MSSILTRRGAMLSTVLAAGGVAVSSAMPGVASDSVGQGVMVRLFWDGGWQVLVPDHEFVERQIADRMFVPGMTVPWRRIPIDQYLAKAESDFGLVRAGESRARTRLSGPPCCPESRIWCDSTGDTIHCEQCGVKYARQE
jgi:hypothetical protein